ncbi:MAG TPA: hypothetical protein DCE43_05480 [Planctomycetaceae bacterium]|nr:hypothetical protein [Planctomycetaceae bacterium]HAA49150.1 hypothetical protein [Planctomycetaceae bacterium]HCK54082.1 hypothetical protein [Planctomycetaceae bacterium]
MRGAILLGVILVASPVLADAWPGFGGTPARDHRTDESLATSLHLAWSRQARHAPRPAWPRDDRMSFDRASRVAVVDGRVFYGSSVDGRLRCLDAETGQTRWTFSTGGPIRFAPAVWRDRLFVTSDDGYLYCLSTTDGHLIERWRGGPTDQQVMGNGHVISRWPARGGVVIADDIVYWAAGIWQSEGIFIRAQRADTGKLVWLNDKSGGIEMPQPHGGATAKSGVTAQGHLVVTGNRLLVPTGRAVPAVFDRGTGQFLYYRLQQNTHRGATATMGHGGVFINGGLAYDLGTGGLLKGLGAGSVASAGKTLWRANGTTLENWQLTQRTGKDRKGKPVTIREVKKLASVADVPGGQGLLVAGDTIVSAGEDLVVVVDAIAGKLAWKHAVDGVPRDLAVSDGRLFVATDSGRLYCFGESEVTRPVHYTPSRSSDVRDDKQISTAADRILKRSGITSGYCVDLGCGDGKLASRLARHSDLFIFAIDPDPARVASARRRLAAQGLLGHRVTVHQGQLESTQFPKYIANLVVSQRALLGQADAAKIAPEAGRLQRPWGGVVAVGPVDDLAFDTRKGLADAGTWNHQYSTPANTLCSTDPIKGPLRVLWFHDVNLELPSRHGRAPSPLFHRGRLFVEGMDALRGVDAYNGRTLWEFALPGVLHAYNADHIVGVSGTGSNFCASGDSVYVRRKGVCYRLDAATGKVLGTFEAPPHADGKKALWGHIACENGLLFGSLINEQHIVKHAWRPADMSRLFTESKTFFVMDAKSGKLKWRYDAKRSIRHNAIAIGDGRVFLIDRDRALGDLLDEKAARRGTKDGKPPVHATGELVCLDAATGKPAWQNKKDIFGTVLVFSQQHDMLLMSYQSTRFKLPSEVGGRMAVFRASEGYRVWDKKVDYITRPLVNDRTIITQPARLDLLTGEDEPWSFKRSYGCGQLAGSKNLLLFRSATVGYVDFTRKAGTENFGGIRPGCWVNALPAGGLVFIPDASAGCRCSYQNRSWVALQGADEPGRPGPIRP